MQIYVCIQYIFFFPHHNYTIKSESHTLMRRIDIFFLAKAIIFHDGEFIFQMRWQTFQIR